MKFFDKETTERQIVLDKSLLHINVLELKSVLSGLKSLCIHLRETHMKVLSNNTTAVCAILLQLKQRGAKALSENWFEPI